MPLFEWDESLSLGIPQIDAQHRVLLDLLNSLYEAILINNTREGYLAARQGAVAYIDEHFKAEEALMREAGYQRIDNHLKNHQKFADKLAELPEEPTGDGAAMAEEFLVFLRDWLLDHIMGGDRMFAQFYLQSAPKN